MVNYDNDPIENTEDIDIIDAKITYVKRLKDSTEIWSLIAFVYYIVQNIYFFCTEGWHITPLSETEKLVDAIGSLLFFCAVFMFVRTIWRMLEVVIIVIDLE